MYQSHFANLAPMQNIWDYARISNEKNDQNDSIDHQHIYVQSYCQDKELTIIGSSSDNKSGMTFERPGLLEALSAARKGLIDTIIVKEISRFGRARGETLFYVDKLRNLGVRVFSISENIDTMNEDSDLLIGIKCIMNDSEPKNASRRVSVMFDSIMKEKGLVIVPPFGYRKDKNTGTYFIEEECAEIIRLIYRKCLDGMGIRTLATWLTDQGIPSPAYYQDKFYKRKYDYTKVSKNYWWNDSSLRQILHNEAYIGTLVCHTTKRSSIYEYKIRRPPSEHYRHEGFYPPIVDTALWQNVQTELSRRAWTKSGVVTNKKKHKYAGLLKCGDCGTTFTAKKRKYNGLEYIEYICTCYNKYGNRYCSPHRIREAKLDDALNRELTLLLKRSKANMRLVDQMISVWNQQKSYDNTLARQLEKKIFEAEETIRQLLLNMAKYPQRTDYFNQLVEEQEIDVERYRKQLDGMEKTPDHLHNYIKSDIIKYEKIVQEVLELKELDVTTLNSLVDGILITEDTDTLNVDIKLKASFSLQMELYEEFQSLSKKSAANSDFITSAICL